jgi:hypothetical protein
VDHRLHLGVRAVGPALRLPRTEADAFRALIYVVVVFAVIIAVVLVIRALS